jgi:single-stranded-DNA-specific exonuclease
LSDYAELEADPGLAAGFDHVVLVDPPPFEHLLDAAGRADAEGRYLHRAWGEAERRFALSVAAEQLAQRPTLIGAFRDLREAGAVAGEELREALRGGGPRRRRAETAARCFRVLAELGLVQGTPQGGGGEVRVVSSEGTDLERSPAFRAYSARHQEAKRFLEGQRQP